MDEIGAHNDNTFRVVYVGNLYSNIDLSEVKKAAQSFKEKNSNVQFVICGNGEYLPIFKNMMKDLDNVIFPGPINKNKVSVLAKRSNVWLLPYLNKENFRLSLPNKTYDALYFGIPLFSSLEGEVKNLIIENEVGMFYDKINSLENVLLNCKIIMNYKNQCLLMQKNFMMKSSNLIKFMIRLFHI